MKTRSIGSLKVSLVGVGCNNFGMRIDEAATARVVDAAIEAGINFFDTADIYGGTRSEEFLGRALGARRSQVIVATKFGMAVDPTRTGARPEYVRQAAEDSLRRLGTDYIDLYQLHQPDPDVPTADTLGAMNELVRAGKVREIGCSNFTPEQLDEAAAASSARGYARFVSVQNEYSLLRRLPERGVLQTCERLDIAFIPYFPLASGLLTGKYRRNETPPEGTRLAGMPAERQAQTFSDKNMDRVDALSAFAREQHHTLLELAMSWLLARPEVASVIAGATKAEQVAANAAAVAWELSPGDLAAIDTLLATTGR